MDGASVTSEILAEVSVISTQGLLILGAVVVIIAGLILWRFGVRKAKGAVR